MTEILLILSSPRGEDSHSTRVARDLVARLQATNPGANVTVRDLGATPLPHIGEDFVIGLGTAEADRSSAQAEAIARSAALVAELKSADTIVIASAMINFGVTSSLKSWVDHVLRAGLTFRYTAEGPVGLLEDKKVYLVEARGGIYSSGPGKANDFQEPYLRSVLSFIGITDVEAIPVEGVAMGEEAAAKGLAAAAARVEALAA